MGSMAKKRNTQNLNVYSVSLLCPESIIKSICYFWNQCTWKDCSSICVRRLALTGEIKTCLCNWFVIWWNVKQLSPESDLDNIFPGPRPSPKCIFVPSWICNYLDNHSKPFCPLLWNDREVVRFSIENQLLLASVQWNPGSGLNVRMEITLTDSSMFLPLASHVGTCHYSGEDCSCCAGITVQDVDLSL